MKTNVERIQKDIEILSQFNATPGRGLTRFSFTEEDRGAREYIKSEMKACGLQVYEDAAGTVIGRLEGEVKGAPTIIVGSHFDSVKNGGNFDGPAGVVMGLEIARSIYENKITTKYPIEFIAMIEEEGGRFGSGLFGSRAMVGKVSREQLDQFKDNEGISIAEAMEAFGLDPNKIQEAARRPEEIKAFFELHIEQGPILEHNKKDVGIVEYIVAINHIEVVVKGRPDHAGTTPMSMRIDALDSATKVISKISAIAKEAGEGTVATVGVLDVSPGATNIVPGEARFTVDIRSKKQECIEKVVKSIEKALKETAKDNKITYTITEKLSVSPIKLDEKIIETFDKNVKKLGFSKESMLSGAGHDAMIMAGITRVGLVFVPSKDGRSHCPEEWTEYKDLQKGIELMYHTILDEAVDVENEG
ncbi:MAG: Zn-dependent hydrolase [Clostridiaceae bacterium]|nr:Zn-dependent hydrolase [Clostridiaceae bacterium]